MSAEQRSGKETEPGHELKGKASDQLRDYIERTGDDSTWKGPDGETDRNGTGSWRPKL